MQGKDEQKKRDENFKHIISGRSSVKFIAEFEKNRIQAHRLSYNNPLKNG